MILWHTNISHIFVVYELKDPEFYKEQAMLYLYSLFTGGRFSLFINLQSVELKKCSQKKRKILIKVKQ